MRVGRAAWTAGCEAELSRSSSLLRKPARAGAVAAVCSALWGILASAAAQEHHGVPAGGAQVVLSGAAYCPEGEPVSGAIVQLFHGSGPGRHLLATSLTAGAGRFAARAPGGTYTLELRYPGLEPHRQRVTVANAPVSVGNVRLQCSPLGLDTLTVGAE